MMRRINHDFRNNRLNARYSVQVVTVQALSGTGALRIAGDFLTRFYAHNKQIFVPTPTWANHIPLFTDAGLEVKYYRYYDKAANGLDWKGLIDDINSAPNKYLPLDSTTNSGELSALA